jgi:hypothetical protein
LALSTSRTAYRCVRFEVFIESPDADAIDYFHNGRVRYRAHCAVSQKRGNEVNGVRVARSRERRRKDTIVGLSRSFGHFRREALPTWGSEPFGG